MSKLSRDEIKALSDYCIKYGYIRLICDGYRIKLKEYRNSKNRIRIFMYINNKFRGCWLTRPGEYEESKFFKQDVFYIKNHFTGKREKFVNRVKKSDFASIGQALRHLNKVCDSVEVWSEDEHDESTLIG